MLSARQVAEEQRRLLDTIDQASAPAIRRLFQTLLKDLIEKLTQVLPRETVLSAAMASIIQRGIAEAEEGFAVELEEAITDSVMRAGRDSAWNLLGGAATGTGLKRVAYAEIAPLVHGLKGSALVLIRRPVASAVEQVASMLNRRVIQVALRKQPVASFIQYAEQIAKEHWWRVARILRTASAWIFNRIRVVMVQRAGGSAYLLRWTELVDDATGFPLDDRVAPDSMVLHGQVVLPGGEYVMPPDDRVRRDLWGKSWVHPPNRPHDRSVLTLWQPGSGVPAWMWKNGARVPAEGASLDIRAVPLL